MSKHRKRQRKRRRFYRGLIEETVQVITEVLSSRNNEKERIGEHPVTPNKLGPNLLLSNISP
jgi:hypothetical protein